MTEDRIDYAIECVRLQVHQGGKLAFTEDLHGGEWYSEYSRPDAPIVVPLSLSEYRRIGAEAMIRNAMEAAR